MGHFNEQKIFENGLFVVSSWGKVVFEPYAYHFEYFLALKLLTIVSFAYLRNLLQESSWAR